MLLFRCTKAACEALSSTRKGETSSWVDNHPLPTGATPWEWQLHAVKIARQTVLVTMHADTRFAMVFWGLKKGDGESLLRLFYERLTNHLFSMAQEIGGLDGAGCEVLLRQLMTDHGIFRFHAGSDRSVQTHINEVVRCCRDAVADNGCLPNNQEEAAGFDEYLNQVIRSVRGGDYFQPSEALLCACLRDFASFDDEGISQVCERLKNNRRQNMV